MIDPVEVEMALATTKRAKGEIAGADLDALEIRFFQSTSTLSEFAALYKEDVPGLYQIAVKGGWVQRRKAFRENMSRDARSKLAERGSDYELKLDSMVHRSTKKLVRLISGILTAATEANEKALAGDDKSKALTLDDLPKIRSGVEALQQAYVLVRKTAGLSPEPQPGRGKFDLTKLTHEERKDFASLLKKASPSEH